MTVVLPNLRTAAFAGITFVGMAVVHAAPLSQERIMQLCAQTDGPGHCGRLIEAEQLKTLPSLAVRDGDKLRVTLFPSGIREFVDTTTVADVKGFALWDYWSPVNAVVMFTSDNDHVGYAVLQRATGKLTTVPAEPVLAPNRQHLAVADFCTADCTNELSVWRIARDGIRKAASFRPPEAWRDVTVSWMDGDTLNLSYSLPGEDKPRTQARRLDAPDWRRN